ncbi:MAG: pirin family protein [Gammaproteobacteria bacterium]|nr:pirin family protein [Gammaproteobacteria bacterium]
MSAKQETRGVTHRFPVDVRREGAGTHITRWFVPADYALTDPFLLFDETKSDKIEEYAGGFPEHPHRGFEALTYMIAGTLRHKDSAGFNGYVGPLGAQWLTNASGLTHDEVPDQTEGLFWCLQLWINLPAANKFDDPFYDESSAEQSPVAVNDSGAEIRVVAGEFEKTIGSLPPVSRPSKPVYLDVFLQEGGQFIYSPPEGYTVLLFVIEDQITIGFNDVAKAGELVLLEKSGRIAVKSERASRFLLMAGLPIKEDIVWHGPFVMNHEEELQQAFSDFSQFGPFQSDTGTGQDN